MCNAKGPSQAYWLTEQLALQTSLCPPKRGWQRHRGCRTACVDSRWRCQGSMTHHRARLIRHNTICYGYVAPQLAYLTSRHVLKEVALVPSHSLPTSGARTQPLCRTSSCDARPCAASTLSSAPTASNVSWSQAGHHHKGCLGVRQLPVRPSWLAVESALRICCIAAAPTRHLVVGVESTAAAALLPLKLST
jgi:hypothetical protein